MHRPASPSCDQRSAGVGPSALAAAVAAVAAVVAICVYLLRPAVSAVDADVAAVAQVAKTAGAVGAAAAAAAAAARAGRLSPFDTTALTDDYPPPADLASFAAAAVRYLVRAAQPDGTFAYEVRVAPDGRVTRSPGYNTLRHAGAIYALGDACLGGERGGGLPAPACVGANATMVRACEWLLRVARMQKPDGGFFSYMDSNGMPNDHRVSLYYPGEAVLGLLSVYAARGEPAHLVAAVRGLEALAASRADKKLVDLPL
ncbi:hypothetical protein I4F81_000559 [Pyropia yezoensis]|uniref:Uncharacterized protein n=1 Tax=Pyropia yezoensis TaxID=2788 RepID=A0ACC3BJM5_PYRYE|nr:hypothetical protein I4F81_000559 [Neopyropia yezoensis]